MKKLVLLAAVAVLALTGNAPVFAADNASSSTEDVVTSVSLIPARVLGFAAGAGLGIPLATVKATVEKTTSYRNRISEALPDSDSPANKAYSTVLAVPAGLLTGVIDGAYYGSKNALKGFEHPFSAESFSATDDANQ